MVDATEINITNNRVVINVTGARGSRGATGPMGFSVPAGGLTGQFLVKDSNADYIYSWHDFNSTTITDALGYVPLTPDEAASKAYVDSIVSGFAVKAPVKTASTANLTLSGEQTVDGIALVAGDRILVKDQTAQAENGIYIVATGAWTRSTDLMTWAETAGAFVFVEEGASNADLGFLCTSDPGGTIGTTAITWSRFSTYGTNLTATYFGFQGVANTFLKGNPSGTLSWSKVDLTTDITGNLPVTNLNNGTDADSTKYWRGDGVWAAPSGAGVGTSVAFGVDPPLDPATYPIWWNTEEGRLKVYFNDTDSPEWVDATPSIQGPPGPAGPAGVSGGYAKLTTLTKNTLQNINDNTWTDITWDATASIDEVSAYNGATNNKIVTTPSGYTKVRISYYMLWSNGGGGGRWVQLVKNGTVFAVDIRPAQNETGTFFCTRWLPTTAGDIFQFNTLQTSGSTLGLGNTSWVASQSYVQFEWAP